jgi:hypothetical protein
MPPRPPQIPHDLAEGVLQSLQEPAAGPYPKPDETNYFEHVLMFTTHEPG